MSVEEETLRIDVFWEALKGYPISVISEAFEDAIRSLKWFPAPAEIIELIPANNPIEIPWMMPTPEGRRLTEEFIRDSPVYKELKEKWDREDKEREERRKTEFEKKRAFLKKQAKLMVKP
jgi:hypothetical protein